MGKKVLLYIQMSTTNYGTKGLFGLSSLACVFFDECKMTMPGGNLRWTMDSRKATWVG